MRAHPPEEFKISVPCPARPCWCHRTDVSCLLASRRAGGGEGRKGEEGGIPTSEPAERKTCLGSVMKRPREPRIYYVTDAFRVHNDACHNAHQRKEVSWSESSFATNLFCPWPGLGFWLPNLLNSTCLYPGSGWTHTATRCACERLITYGLVRRPSISASECSSSNFISGPRRPFKAGPNAANMNVTTRSG
ncbi:hypothetical protein LZ30DRAFT_196650 [Colletotrichum cereale]|nr:hypothetical protein LZ30DRAFT_196650 [Colletotrichum cereale]